MCSSNKSVPPPVKQTGSRTLDLTYADQQVDLEESTSIDIASDISLMDALVHI